MEIKLSNNDVVIFPDKYKGKHLMAVEKLSYTKKTDEDSRSFLIDNMDKLLVSLGCEIRNDKGENIPISMDYLGELDADDYFILADKGGDAVLKARGKTKAS